MTTAMGICQLGMINDLHQLDIIGQNLANADTAGYKRDMAVIRSFDTVLSEELSLSASGMDWFRQSEPVPRVRSLADHSPGALRHTGNPLDVAIEEEGFFELGGPDGVRYTRRGAFSLDSAGRLVAANGLAVASGDGDIMLHGGDVKIDKDGKITEDGEYAGRLKLVAFADPSALTRIGGGMWLAPAGSTARPAEDARVRQGYVESSNVAALDEMVRMIATLRHFETTANVIKGYDEMVGTAISTIAEL